MAYKDKNAQKEFYKRNESKISTRYRRMKYRDKELHQGLCDITLEQYVELMNSGCEICGENLISGICLDRKDTDQGYVLHNVIPCCGRCNKLRNVHYTIEEMKIGMKALGYNPRY